MTLHLMLCCPVCSHLSLAGTPAILSMVTWEDRSRFLQLPSPFSRRRNPGPPSSLLSESGSWGGPHVQHFRQLLFPRPPTLPAQHCSPVVGLRAPSTGTDLPKAEHHSPLSPPHGRNPQHRRWATVSHALHLTHTALSSQQCQVHYEESQSLIFFFFFVCVFIRSPLFFQPPIFLLGPSP